VSDLGPSSTVDVVGLVRGTTYYWQSRVQRVGRDRSRRFAVVPPERSGRLAPFFSDDMEGGTAAGGPHAMGLTTEAAHSGVLAWSDSPTTGLRPNLNVWILTPAIDLSSAATPQLNSGPAPASARWL